MTFSYETKQELCRLQNRHPCCEKAECGALLLFSRYLMPDTEAVQLEHSAVARRMAELTGLTTGVFPQITMQLSKRRGSVFSAPGAGGEQIRAFFSLPAAKYAENTCCAAAFIRGAFLTCGTLADPAKQYELDFTVQAEESAKILLAVLTNKTGLGLQPGFSKRQGGHMIYLKDSTQIEDLLTFMGATNASMSLMQTKMYKEALNNINRKSNFETANIDKTYSASARQTAAIAIISDLKGLDSLEESLGRVARLRLENTDMTLKELAEALGMSRSGVNHKLNKLLAIGNALMGQDGYAALTGRGEDGK